MQLPDKKKKSRETCINKIININQIFFQRKYQINFINF